VVAFASALPVSRSTRPENADLRSRRVFGVKALSDAETLPRILGIFAQRDIVPREMSCSRAGAYLLVNVEIEALALDTAEALLAKLRQLLLVERAHLAGASSSATVRSLERPHESQGVGHGLGSGRSFS
jgi:putative lipoic acid-binding regulatory protein